MSARTRRRRAVLLLALALACGGLAASEVGSRVRDIEAQVGRPVPVLVAARDLEPGAALRRSDLAVKEVPERFVPPGALAAPEEAVGSEASSALPRGGYLTASALAGGSEREAGEPSALRRGERAVEVAVAGGAALAERVAPNGRVDVIVSTEQGDGAGRAFLALESVQLLDLRAGVEGPGAAPKDGESAAAAASAVATLRVTIRQAVYLTAAQNFAREVRLLPRPPGDRRRAGRASYAANAL
jgi:pilus assembly protein CpaB